MSEIDELLARLAKEAAARKKAAPPQTRIRQGEELLETYRVESEAIEGGMGSVWRVRHKSWQMELAMKRPREEFFQSAAQKEDFTAECKAWIELGLHPNIVSCYYVREIDGVPSIFSEWMDKGSLKDQIDSASLYTGSEAELTERLLDIAIQLARGLHYAHERGLVHQDVKPHNVLLCGDWDAKLADFGIARAKAKLGSASENARFPEGTAVAAAGVYTLAYCSPEQMAGKDLSRRTDIYSWAVTVMEMYKGERLWASGEAAGLNCGKYLSELRVPLPAGMEALLRRCLAQNEAERPVDFAAVEQELLNIYRREIGAVYPRSRSKAAADTADSLNNRALSFLDLGQEQTAEALWDRAVAADPGNVRAAYNRALFLWRRGRLTDASAVAAVKAAAGYRSDQDAYACLLRLYLESGNPCADATDCYAALQKEEALNRENRALPELAADFFRRGTQHPLTANINAMVSSGGVTAAWEESSRALHLCRDERRDGLRLNVQIMAGIRSSHMALDGSGRVLALALQDENLLFVMDTAERRELARFKPQAESFVNAVALSDNAQLLAYGMANATVCLSELRGELLWSKKELRVPGRLSALRFDESGELLAVGYSALVKAANRDLDVHIFRVSTGELLTTLVLKDACRDLRFSPDGKGIYVWSGEELSCWEVDSGEKLFAFAPDTVKADASAMSESGRYLLIGRDASVTELWDSAERRCLRTVKLPALPVEGELTHGEIRAVGFDRDSILISGDNGLWRYPLLTNRPRAAWLLSGIADYKKADAAQSAFEALLEEAKAAAEKDPAAALEKIGEARKTKGFENDVRALDAKWAVYERARLGNSTILGVFPRSVCSGRVTALDMDAAGKCCAVLIDGEARLLACPGFREVCRIKAAWADELHLTSDGAFLLLTSAEEEKAALYRSDNGQLCWTARELPAPVMAAACSPDGRYTALLCGMSSFLMLDRRSGKLLWRKQGKPCLFTTLTFSPDSRFLVLPGNESSERKNEYNDLDYYAVADFRLCKRIERVSKGGMNGFSLPEQGQNVFASSWDRHIYLAEKDGERREGLQWHDHAPTAICAMQDGSHIFSGDQEGIICMQRVLPEPCFDFTYHSEIPADRIRLSRNGRYMAVLSYGRQAALYELDIDYKLLPADINAADVLALLARVQKEAKERMNGK